jgi:hypothetical protein
MSTQKEAAAAYLSELLRQKEEEVKADEARVKELEAALERVRAQFKKSSEEKELLALSKRELEKPAEPEAKTVPPIPQKEPVEAPQEEAPQEAKQPPPSPPAAKKTFKRSGRKKGSKNKKTKASKGGKKPEVRQITKGARPPLKKTMHSILGADRIMSAPEMVEALKEAGCVPRSQQPQVLVSWTFSNNRDAFIRVSHGKYRANAAFRPRDSKAPPPSLSREEVDSELADMGLGDIGNESVENPFQS